MKYTIEAKLYLQGFTVHEVGRKLNLSGAGVWKKLRAQKIPLRSSGPKNRPWAIKKRGKMFLGSDGRWWIRGLRSTSVKNSKHRSIVNLEKTLGGYSIPRGFHVHHLDGNQQNDSIANLIVIPAFEHSRITGCGPNPKKAYMKGRKHSQVTIKKMSLIRIKYWKKRREL